MARILKGFQFYLHTPRTSGMNHAFAFPAKLVLIYRSRRDRRLSWLWVASWLHTENKCPAPGIEPGDTVAHLSTNRARLRLTSLIEPNALTTTLDHRHLCIDKHIQCKYKPRLRY